MREVINLLVNAPRSTKRLITLLVDAIFIGIAFFSAFAARLENLSSISDLNNWILFCYLLPISLFVFIKLGLYRAILRYMNLQALWAVTFGCLFSLVSFIGLSFILNINIPRTVPFIFASFCILLIGGSRLIGNK